MTYSAPEVSVVLPIFNEESNLRELHSRIVAAMEKSGRSFEIVAVDDGSTDNSLDLLKQIRADDDRLRIVRLARNFGQTPAVYAAFPHVRGKFGVVLDADLQNPPEEIPKFVETLNEGYDVVNGWREHRQDSLFRRSASRVFNLCLTQLMNVRMRDCGCSLRAFRREVTDRMSVLKHRSRYLPADIVWLGARMTEVKVRHTHRKSGESKYGLFDLFRISFDLITTISAVPIQLIGLAGLLFSLVGFGMGIRIGIMRLFSSSFKSDPLATVLALFFFLAGIQMIATFIMCEYIRRIYIETQQKPFYLVDEVIE